jgi:hypothetical protein
MIGLRPALNPGRGPGRRFMPASSPIDLCTTCDGCMTAACESADTYPPLAALASGAMSYSNPTRTLWRRKPRRRRRLVRRSRFHARAQMPEPFTAMRQPRGGNDLQADFPTKARTVPIVRVFCMRTSDRLTMLGRGQKQMGGEAERHDQNKHGDSERL